MEFITKEKLGGTISGRHSKFLKYKNALVLPKLI